MSSYNDGPISDPLSWEQSQSTYPAMDWPPPEPGSGENPQPDPALAKAANPQQEAISW